MKYAAVATLCLLSICHVAFADTDWGTVEPRDWEITYSTSTYSSTTAFCQAWRLACIDYVGSRNYHHQVECPLTQPGPTVDTICAGVLKQANGDYGTGPPFDFTTFLVDSGSISGVSIADKPTAPITAYAGDGAASSAAPAQTTTSSPSAGPTSSETDNAITFTTSISSSSVSPVDGGSPTTTSYETSISYAQYASNSSSDSGPSADIVTATSSPLTLTSALIQAVSTPLSTSLASTSGTNVFNSNTSTTSDALRGKSIFAALILVAIGSSLLLL